VRPLAYEILLVSLAGLNMMFLGLKIYVWESIVQLRCMRSTTGHLYSVSRLSAMSRSDIVAKMPHETSSGGPSIYGSVENHPPSTIQPRSSIPILLLHPPGLSIAPSP
jgi:hypothetical protein